MLNGIGIYGMAVHHAARAAEAVVAAGEGRRARTVAEVARELRWTNERLDQLVLASTALWSLLKEKTGLTEEDLLQRVQEIDLQDGVADGKITRSLQKCGNCGRTVSKRHNRCLYCGSESLSETPFDAV